jgi:hypothetical protein
VGICAVLCLNGCELGVWSDCVVVVGDSVFCRVGGVWFSAGIRWGS